MTEGLGRGDRRERDPIAPGDIGGPIERPRLSEPGLAGGTPPTGPADGLGLVRVEATTYSEALRDIRARFGDDVRIVHTRVIRRKGMLGVLGATGVEVYVTGRGEYEEWRREPIPERAAEPYPPRTHSPGSSSPPSYGPGARAPGADRPSSSGPGAGHRAATPAAHGPAYPRPPRQEATVDRGKPQETPDFVAALERLSRHVGRVMAEKAHGGGVVPQNPPSQPILAGPSAPARPAPVDPGDRGVHVASWTSTPTSHPVVAAAKKLLEEGGFSPQFAAELLAKLSRRNLPTLTGDPGECRDLARLQLRELVRPKLPPTRPIPRPEAGRRTVVALAGPTGVGKTTTLAKLGALFRITERASVAFITLDTYRIGAVDQLRRYSEIIQVPLEVVSPGFELSEALERVRDADLVLIDTAGRSQKDAARIAELRDMLEGAGELEVHLCLALSASPEAIVAAAENFRDIGYSRILFTKLDEAYRHGVLLDLFAATRTPVSYLTCGQEVPDDIRPATLDRLEDLLMGEM